MCSYWNVKKKWLKFWICTHPESLFYTHHLITDILIDWNFSIYHGAQNSIEWCVLFRPQLHMDHFSITFKFRVNMFNFYFQKHLLWHDIKLFCIIYQACKCNVQVMRYIVQSILKFSQKTMTLEWVNEWTYFHNASKIYFKKKKSV